MDITMNTKASAGSIMALHGRQISTLTENEKETLAFYLLKDRQYGIAISVINNASAVQLAQARSKQEAEEIMLRADSTISVTSLEQVEIDAIGKVIAANANVKNF